jgi:hypothetical protein
MMRVRLWFAFGVALMFLCIGQGANAIDPAAAGETRTFVGIKYGESCRRLNDGKPGIFKRDACNRTYCGLIKVKDIIEIRPNFSDEHACTWQLVEAQCKCLKASRP